MTRAPLAGEEHLWSYKDEGESRRVGNGGVGYRIMVAGSESAEKLSPSTQTYRVTAPEVQCVSYVCPSVCGGATRVKGWRDGGKAGQTWESSLTE